MNKAKIITQETAATSAKCFVILVKPEVKTFFPGGPQYFISRGFVARLIRKVRSNGGDIRYHRQARRVMIGDQHYYLTGEF